MKKFYSARHVQNVLSQAVVQIEESFDFGIVAVNLDDLIPANNLLAAPTQERAEEIVKDKFSLSERS